MDLSKKMISQIFKTEEYLYRNRESLYNSTLNPTKYATARITLSELTPPTSDRKILSPDPDLDRIIQDNITPQKNQVKLRRFCS